MAKTSSAENSFDSCITCSSKYNRVRPALCQCKHCSESFCFDCMKDHNDDLQQNIAQLLNRYNELKDLINEKRKLITNETIKSKEQMSEWLRKYIDNLIVEKARIDMDIEKAEKEAQKFVLDIEAQLNTFSNDIKNLTKNSTFQSAHLEKLLEKLNELLQGLSPLAAIREYELPSTMPQYKYKFNYSPEPTTDNTQQAPKASGKQDHEESKTNEQPKVEEQNRSDLFVSDITTSWGWGEATNTSFADENDFHDRDRYEATSYSVNLMASDGINIMYSTVEHSQHDIIAYCYLDVRDDNYGRADPYRAWYLPRIVDMIWWNSIDKFVCATEAGIYTVEYLNERFKILSVINGRWTNVRVAANTENIWIHVKEKIMIYNINFVLVRSINFDIPCIITRESFCITDNLVAFLVIRGDRTNSNILQAQFYNTNMIRLRTFDVGLGEAPCMIRTDGRNLFFIAGGEEMFYIMSSDGYKRVIDLGKQASCLAVINSRSIILTKSRSDLELVRY